MSGVWVFKNGVVRLDNDRATVDYSLVHVPTGEVISSYVSLTEILLELGWKPYDEGINSELLQFVKDSDFISLPKNFNKFQGVYKLVMVATNNPGVFKLVQEANEQKETTAAAEGSS